jgi:hypothetical protein
MAPLVESYRMPTGRYLWGFRAERVALTLRVSLLDV